MRARALLVLAAFNLVGPAFTVEPSPERFFQLRDGSLLRLPLVNESRHVHVVRPEGRIEDITVRLREVSRLSLAPERSFDRIQALLATIRRLGADEFAEREQAQAELAQLGPGIRFDLESVRGLFSDPEIKARLRVVLEQWRESKAAVPEPAFDFLTTREALTGDAGDAGIPVLIDGKAVRLTRKDVATMSIEAPQGAVAGTSAAGHGLRRLQAEEFPRGCLEEGFENTPDGRRLRPGENIERLFIRKGFTLATSVKTSYVSVNDFAVQGKSRGFSAATHQPLFTGEITITFVKPGHEHIPAGVTHFGCWIAWIEPNGTSLHAYDLQGREIGTIATTRTGHEFLGMTSAIPIHRIRVVPNLKIDADYTLDDFIYSPPQSADIAHPKKVSVHFTNGEQILCNDVSFSAGGVRLLGMPAGLPDRLRPLTDVLRVVSAGGKKADGAPPLGVFVEFQDGSVLFGAKPAGMGTDPVFARRPDLLRDPEKIIGLWSAAQPRDDWPFFGPDKYPAVGATDEAKKTSWRPVETVRLTEGAVEWTVAVGAPKVRTSYFEVAPVLLKQSLSSAADTWHLRTRLGEDIVVGPADLPRLNGRLSQGVTVPWQGKNLGFSAGEIELFYRVPKKP